MAAKHSTFLSLIITLSLLISSAAFITTEELDATTAVLSSNRYNLFGNAMATSDLRYEILSAAVNNSSFTIFSPLDSALFFLDMVSPASAYVQTLHYHVSPRRLTFSDLRHNLSYVDTLLPHHNLLINTDPLNDTVFVDGVRISSPDLFLGPQITVHGLDGILIPRELGFESVSPEKPPSLEFLSPSPQGSVAPAPDYLSPKFPPQDSPPREFLSPKFPPQASPPSEFLAPKFQPQSSPLPVFLSPQFPPQFEQSLILTPRYTPWEINNKGSAIKNLRRQGMLWRLRRDQPRGRFSKFVRHSPKSVNCNYSVLPSSLRKGLG